ncbi:MAG: hypothetical protein ABL958_03365 [Bdellovibrionia bacterium]
MVTFISKGGNMRQVWLLSLIFAMSCAPSTSDQTKTNSDNFAVTASCTDFSGSYTCTQGSLKIQQASCQSLELIEGGTNPLSMTWITDGQAHHEQPGATVGVTWTAYHSTDGLHHFVGSFDSYKNETVTYRRHLSKRPNGDLAIYYFKSRNNKVEEETTTICNP